MDATPFDSLLVVDLQPSRAAAALVITLHGLAVAILFTLPLTLWQAAALGVAIVAYGLSVVRRQLLLRGSHAVVQVSLDGGGQWRLMFADGREADALLLPDSYLHPKLMVLRFALGWRRYAVVITPAMARPATRRRLAARLRLGAIRGLRSSDPG